MMREFDIPPLYFYMRENDIIDCVDGRQRVGAIRASCHSWELTKGIRTRGSSSENSMNCMTKTRILSESWTDLRFRLNRASQPFDI